MFIKQIIRKISIPCGRRQHASAERRGSWGSSWQTATHVRHLEIHQQNAHLSPNCVNKATDVLDATLGTASLLLLLVLFLYLWCLTANLTGTGKGTVLLSCDKAVTS